MLGLVVFASIAASSTDTAAQRPPSADSDHEQTSAARALFEEGLRLLDRQEWSDAADRFERAYALRASPQIAYNLATAWIGGRELVRASEMLSDIIRQEDTPAEVRAAAEGRREERLPQLARLTIELEGPREGTEIHLDDRRLEWAMIGVATPVDPGDHIVTARREGEIVAEERISLAAGAADQVRLRVPLPRVADVATGPVSPAPIEDSGGSVLGTWWFWTGLVLVVAAAATVAVVLATSGDGAAEPIQGSAGVVFFGGGE
jgi:hypothetical protein